ncbi:hypothetical protein [Teredinibacter haidensis]|uniref:hypothetical protein n=1 Tax=Teredinibacter haidensis TaxID=2731755 RepID=UPI001588194D|nr:hypothetical protein [Teredinibacter haidensis]
MQLRNEHATAWRKAVIGLLSNDNIQIPTDWEAKLQRHYPRDLAEVQAKKYITTKPNRK